MKALYISSAILLSIIAVACSHKSSDTSNESTISNFRIVQTVKSATRNYICKGANAVFADSLPIYSKVHLTIQWPEELGGFNIQPLQDSIMTAIYETPKTSIDETILAALDPPEGSDTYIMEEIDSIPSEEQTMTLYRDKIASAITFSPSYIVYQIMTASYGGGAHGMTVSRFINYDFDSTRVITPQLAFKAGCDETLLKAIQEQLMAMCQVRSLNELDNYGIFSNQIFVSPEFYLQGYNIVFHYNPYDIAPYSTGSINVPVPYYSIRECLSPEVLRLLTSTEI
ncbi:RsiV family protein [Muribaculum intestinale]|uniref:DUF3298 domain-containing protein n=1 Tax=Muribaculum intestinale TaxID=1796646 RepID=A0A4S2FJX7_9BACT|nr:RsiV family protein [Muribaculum intestinale]MYM12050.1 DUF3298 domain-containing protein [Muribaculum intestinale]TGY69243.1 DUF3298 domain-containing protein [Muribaculum intestinale]